MSAVVGLLMLVGCLAVLRLAVRLVFRLLGTAIVLLFFWAVVNGLQ